MKDNIVEYIQKCYYNMVNRHKRVIITIVEKMNYIIYINVCIQYNLY